MTTVWVDWCIEFPTWQTNVAADPSRTGTPCGCTRHAPAVNRSSPDSPVRPAKTSATSCWSAASTFTENQPVVGSALARLDERLRQTTSIGGSADSDVTAVAVSPARPDAGSSRR